MPTTRWVGRSTWESGLILARADEPGDLVMLKAHARLTAYALASQTVPPELTGSSESRPKCGNGGLH